LIGSLSPQKAYATVTNVYQQDLEHQNYGQITFDSPADVFKGFNTKALMEAQQLPKDPEFGLPNAFQAPRSLRMQVSFFF
jgi:hypothetical protein